MKGIFYNSQKSLCSIWESGKMCYDALKKSNKYYLDYSEEKKINYSYDFIIINYHHQVNNWITFDIIKNFTKPTFCIVTEVTFDISPIKMSPNFFNHYIVLDPTVNENEKIHAFGRPLEEFNLNFEINKRNTDNIINQNIDKNNNLFNENNENNENNEDNEKNKNNKVNENDEDNEDNEDNKDNEKNKKNKNNENDEDNEDNEDNEVNEYDEYNENNENNENKVIEISNYKKEDKIIINEEIPKIGSFGFATQGKEWCKLIEQVQKEFDNAKIHFNIPKGTYVSSKGHNKILKEIYINSKKIIKKPGILIKITSLNLSKEELIKLCCEKTINCFFYNRNYLYSAGLSAVTDQAISSGQPLLVTGDRTFRHIHKYIPYYPNISIKKAIEITKEGVLKMKNDWSSNNFCLKFENILFNNNFMKN